MSNKPKLKSTLTHGHRLHLAIEGIDGTGKSTALSNVAELLEEEGHTVSIVRYTGRIGMMGNVISSIYHREHSSKLINTVASYRPLQAVLYATNGRINLAKHQRGSEVLLADRSVLSGYASHVGRVPNWLIDAAESTMVPDVIAYLELPLSDAAKRIGIREDGSAGFEEDTESLQKFSDDYERVIANPPPRLKSTIIERIDASRNELDVAQSIAEIALKHLS